MAGKQSKDQTSIPGESIQETSKPTDTWTSMEANNTSFIGNFLQHCRARSLLVVVISDDQRCLLWYPRTNRPRSLDTRKGTRGSLSYRKVQSLCRKAVNVYDHVSLRIIRHKAWCMAQRQQSNQLCWRQHLQHVCIMSLGF